MTKGRVSVIIPSCNERHLQKTIDSVLAGAHGDVEVLACLDAWWPNPPLKDDPRVKVLHWGERTHMRPMENAAAAVATGEFLLKLDSHCILAPGWDAALKADCDGDWLVVPTRHSIDEARWTVSPRDFNYHVLTYPYIAATMYGEGFHGITFSRNSHDIPSNASVNAQRVDHPIDDILSAQGSAWFQRREYFLSFPPLDHERMYFYQESQEVMFRILAAGGRCVINKKTWYAHLHKGRDNKGADGRPGRGFYLDLRKKRKAEATMVEWCLRGWPESWPSRSRTFDSIIDQHWWLISQMKDPRYAWPVDWSDWDKHRIAFENRPTDQLPAHI